MTFFEELQSHRGGLLRIKSELYWHDGRGWDGTPDRICLVLDAALTGARELCDAHANTVDLRGLRAEDALAVLLLIDGCPQWVWVAQEDVELIT